MISIFWLKISITELQNNHCLNWRGARTNARDYRSRPNVTSDQYFMLKMSCYSYWNSNFMRFAAHICFISQMNVFFFRVISTVDVLRLHNQTATI
jgi:hypothetical protein